MNISLVEDLNIARLNSVLLLLNGKLHLLPAADYDVFTPNEIRVFCHKHARYGLPTIETVEYLKKLIGDRSAIEIGAGHGDLGYHLGIPMTDSKCQMKPEVMHMYAAMGQPTIQYPADVEKLEALEAVKKYKPQIVIGSWVTQYVSPYQKNPNGGSVFGVKEDELLKLVETYIVIGNLDAHGDKDIMKLPHEEISLPGLRSRASNPDNDRIFIWNR